MKLAEKSPQSLVFPLYLISGHTRQNNHPVDIAYLGTDQKKLVQWAALIMEVQNKNLLGEFPISGLKKFLHKQYPKCSLLFVEKDLPGGNENFGWKGFSLPYFMQTFINISAPIEKLNNESKSGFANAGRLTRKYDLTCEIVNTPEAQHDFYYNMYLPYLSNRLGEAFQEVAFHNVFSKDIPTEIIHIKANNGVVSGGVFRIKNDKAWFSFLGVKEGLFENVKKGALSAAYFFLCDELHKRGFDKLYMGGSPPFINHSITKYKTRMTAQIDKDYKYNLQELTSLFLLKSNKATRDFLSNSPFVSINETGKNIGVVWVDDKNDLVKTGNFEKEINRVFRLGLDECEIIYLGKKPKMKAVSDEFENKTIHFVSGRKYFDNRLIMKFHQIYHKVSGLIKAIFRSFDEAGYLAANPDVAKAVKDGKFRSGKQHYIKFGKSEGRIFVNSLLK